MNIDTYHIEMSTLIENGPYQLLNKDPTDCMTQLDVVQKAANLEVKWISIRGPLEQNLTLAQTAA